LRLENCRLAAGSKPSEGAALRLARTSFRAIEFPLSFYPLVWPCKSQMPQTHDSTLAFATRFADCTKVQIRTRTGSLIRIGKRVLADALRHTNRAHRRGAERNGLRGNVR
jgi:hypothetical protein